MGKLCMSCMPIFGCMYISESTRNILWICLKKEMVVLEI